MGFGKFSTRSIIFNLSTMSFLDLTPQQQTGIQIKSWINSLHSNIDSAKANYDNLVNWLAIVETNDEYSPEDKTAVISELSSAVLKIKSLLPTE